MKQGIYRFIVKCHPPAPAIFVFGSDEDFSGLLWQSSKANGTIIAGFFECPNGAFKEKRYV
jgi:hypothetical protein